MSCSAELGMKKRFITSGSELSEVIVDKKIMPYFREHSHGWASAELP